MATEYSPYPPILGHHNGGGRRIRDVQCRLPGKGIVLECGAAIPLWMQNDLVHNADGDLERRLTNAKPFQAVEKRLLDSNCDP